MQASVERCGFEIRCQIIWAKPKFAISRGHYDWQHEPCWYAVRKGKTGQLRIHDMRHAFGIKLAEEGCPMHYISEVLGHHSIDFTRRHYAKFSPDSASKSVLRVLEGLFLLSHGFRKDTCLVGLAKLAKSVLMSQRKVQNTIAYLEKRGLIERVESKLGGSARGNLYRVPMPCPTPARHATLAQGATVARDANNKEKLDDDDLKNNHHQRAETSEPMVPPVENHSCAAAPRERPESADRHFVLIRAAYEKTTGNRWKKSDSEAYEKNGLRKLPAETSVSAIEAVAQRTPAKINSFRYFVQELVALPDPGNRAWRKKQLEKIVRRIQENSVGRAEYSAGDFVEDVKRACAREAVPFDNDLFNELLC